MNKHRFNFLNDRRSKVNEVMKENNIYVDPQCKHYKSRLSSTLSSFTQPFQFKLRRTYYTYCTALSTVLNFKHRLTTTHHVGDRYWISGSNTTVNFTANLLMSRYRQTTQYSMPISCSVHTILTKISMHVFVLPLNKSQQGVEVDGAGSKHCSAGIERHVKIMPTDGKLLLDCIHKRW